MNSEEYKLKITKHLKSTIDFCNNSLEKIYKDHAKPTYEFLGFIDGLKTALNIIENIKVQ
jgi:ABC-type transport system involved in cytochrome c biogenesis ATPase subunit